jgi:hypothetical protein
MTEAEVMVDFADKVMPLYIESAKTYAQLSMAALGVTITFKEKVLGARPGRFLDALFLSSWFCFVLAIGASAYYQWVAVRLIQYVKDDQVYFPLTVSWLWPGYAYGVMVSCFFLATLLLVVTATGRLRVERSEMEPLKDKVLNG